ncbi:unnamed protein product [Brassicogethes aeneus]|uniref:Peptidase S1 domain-containing protein n=1 Tax=Brassicogethes aeneus TaxID=1431903 RepID=A0A9P0BAB0_BRAAE|nr:unnamed protein product [Brassicogethes aeneus]
MWYSYFIFVCFFLEKGSSQQLKIIHGAPVIAPYQAEISIQDGRNEKRCGGSLIKKKYVLTAAHCFDGRNENTVVAVVLGTNNLSSNDGQWMEILSDDIIIHKNYSNSGLENDIALIRLSTDADLNDYIQLINLQREDAHLSGKTVLATGFGLINDSEEISDLLLGVNLTLIPNNLCSIGYKNIFDTQICTLGKDDKSPCRGDSGGPLVDVETGLQVGIISYGTKYCEIGWPTVNIRVSKYIEWIETSAIEKTQL